MVRQRHVGGIGVFACIFTEILSELVFAHRRCVLRPTG
jgi:hypothetical protein